MKKLYACVVRGYAIVDSAEADFTIVAHSCSACGERFHVCRRVTQTWKRVVAETSTFELASRQLVHVMLSQ